MDKNSKIYITGHKGLVGSALLRVLEKSGYTNLVFKTAQELDLLNNTTVAAFFKTEKPECVFMAAYKSGSILANINYPADFIYENLLLQNNIIQNAYLNGVKKLIFFGASCVYPKNSPQPIKEEYLLMGEIEETSKAYGVAKIAGIEMCRAYNKQYGTKFVSVVPATIYGPGDHFDPETSHVLSALLRKFHEARINNQKEVVLWGSGNPKREFLYADDLADACLFLMENNIELDLINIGTGIDLTIRDLANIIKGIVGFAGEIEWDASMPDGAERKLLDVNRLHSLGWSPKVVLEDGIKETYQWFVNNYVEL